MSEWRNGGSGRSDDLAILHVNDTVRLGGELVVMRDNDERRSACLVQAAHQPEQPVPALCVEVSGRFVGQDQVRILHQRACHGHPLLFTPRELPWLVVKAMPQSNVREQRCGIGLDGSRFAALHERRHAGIFQRGELGKQVMELKHEPYPSIPEFSLLCIRHPEEVLPIERDSASGRFIKGSDNVE